MEQEGKWLNHNSTDLGAENYKTAIGNSKMTITLCPGGVIKRVLSPDNPDLDPVYVCTFKKYQEEVLFLIVLSRYVQTEQ